MQNLDRPQYKPVLYKVRWVIAVALSLYQGLSLSNLTYGVVNDVYVKYFRIAYAQADLMTTGFYVGCIPALPILAWLYVRGQIQLRRLTLIGTGMMTLGLLILSCAFLDRSLYGLSVTGQILNGIAAVLAKSIISAFAVAWFPDNEVGTVIGMNSFGSSFGAVMSTAVMGFVVYPKHYNIDTFNLTNPVATSVEAVEGSVRSLFIYNISCATAAFCVFVFMAVFIKDHPPTPPTLAQAMKREAVDSTKTIFRQFFNETKKLFTDGTFVLLAICWGLYMQAITVQLVFMGQIIRSTKTSDPYSKTAWALISYYGGCLAGSILGGKLMDKLGSQRYVLIMKVSSLCALSFSVANAVCVAFYRVWFVVGCNLLFGVSARTCFVTIMEVVSQHAFPIDEAFSGLYVLLVDVICGIIITEVGRLIYNNLGGVAVMAFQCSVMLIGAIICWTARIQLRRAAAERGERAKLLEADANSTQ